MITTFVNIVKALYYTIAYYRYNSFPDDNRHLENWNWKFEGEIGFFQKIKVGTSVIPYLCVIFTRKSIPYIFLHDSRSYSMSKGQLQGQVIETLIFTK